MTAMLMTRPDATRGRSIALQAGKGVAESIAPRGAERKEGGDTRDATIAVRSMATFY